MTPEEFTKWKKKDKLLDILTWASIGFCFTGCTVGGFLHNYFMIALNLIFGFMNISIFIERRSAAAVIIALHDLNIKMTNIREEMFKNLVNLTGTPLEILEPSPSANTFH